MNQGGGLPTKIKTTILSPHKEGIPL